MEDPKSDGPGIMRFLRLTVFTVLLLSCLVLLLSCKGEKVCVHEFGDWIALDAATCTKDGTLARACLLCGHTEYETAPMLGHRETVLSAVAPTCTDTGLTEGKKCSACGTILVEQT